MAAPTVSRDQRQGTDDGQLIPEVAPFAAPEGGRPPLALRPCLATCSYKLTLDAPIELGVARQHPGPEPAVPPQTHLRQPCRVPLHRPCELPARRQVTA